MNKTQWTVNDIPPQTGKLAVVTGANSGIGGHTALELARAGSEVILAARSEAKGRDAVERIRRELPSANVHFETLDLASLRSVRAFAAMVNREARLVAAAIAVMATLLCLPFCLYFTAPGPFRRISEVNTQFHCKPISSGTNGRFREWLHPQLQRTDTARFSALVGVPVSGGTPLVAAEKSQLRDCFLLEY